MPLYNLNIAIHDLFRFYLPAVVVAACMACGGGHAAPVASDPPGLWDLRRRPDRPDLRAIQQIRFLTEDEYPPFNFQGSSGTLEGFNVDLARAICAELAVPCTVQARRWDTIVAALEAGQGDVIAASLAANGRSARAPALHRRPTIARPARFVVKRDGVADVSPKALAGKRVAVVGRHRPRGLSSGPSFRTPRLVARPTEAAAREALRRQARPTSCSATASSLRVLAQRDVVGRLLPVRRRPLSRDRYFGEGIGMALRPADDTLRRAIDFALFRLWEDGAYADLVRRWFPVSPFGKTAFSEHSGLASVAL